MPMRSMSIVRDDQSPLTGASPYIGPPPLYRDALDAARSMWRAEPSAHYPDGYIDSAITSRRADRIATAIWRNQRAYSRGVHKGERLDMTDYLWPDEFNLMSGIQNEVTGRRYVSPAFGEDPVLLVNDGKPGPRDLTGGETQPVPVIPDPSRAAQLKRLVPSYR